MPHLFLESALLKHCTRTVIELLLYYKLFWLTDANKFFAIVSCFKQITTPLIIDLTIQHSITSTVISTVPAAIASAQAKHKEDMLVLRKMIGKSRLFRKSSSSTSPSDLKVSSKLALPEDLPIKSTEK